MKYRPLLLCSTLLLFVVSYGQSKIAPETYTSVMRLPDSISINQGSLKLYNLFKVQVQTIYENQNQSEEAFRKAVLNKTYYPFESFWTGYVGDSKVYFEEIITPLLKDSLKLIESRSTSYAQGKVDHFFQKMAQRMQKQSGYTPKGKWYLAFGSGVTDLGGFGGGTMVLDLTHPKTTLDYTQFILPHELTHQIFDLTNKEDPSAKGLYRCINEGFAVYMNQRLLGTKYPLHTYLQYTDKELQYCLSNEATIYKKLSPFLLTDNADHAQALADRGQRIFKDGPGAIGYFLGYRICEAYIKKNGKNSWKDLFTKPVKTILQDSGYDPR